MGASDFEGAEKMLDLNQSKTPQSSDCSAGKGTRTRGASSSGRGNPTAGRKNAEVLGIGSYKWWRMGSKQAQALFNQ